MRFSLLILNLITLFCNLQTTEDLTQLINAIKSKSQIFQVKKLVQKLVKQNIELDTKFDFEFKNNKDTNTIYNGTLMHLAAIVNPAAIRILIKKGVSLNSVDVEDNTPLHLACQYKCRKSVIILINAGCLVNQKNIWGLTPFFYAVYNQHLKVIKFLLEYIDLSKDILDGFDYTHLAASLNNTKILDMLLDCNLSLDSRDSNLETPLHWAVYDKAYDSISFLIKKEALVNSKNKDGDTPLHIAASLDCYKPAEILLSNAFCINTEIRNLKNLKPIDIAKDINNIGFIKLLFLYIYLPKLLTGTWAENSKNSSSYKTIYISPEIAKYIASYIISINNSIKY